MSTTLNTPRATGTGPNKWSEPLNFQNLSLGNTNPTFFVSDMDKQQSDFVTRDHWQRETGNDKCNLPGCNKVVGKSGAGKQHCRK